MFVTEEMINAGLDAQAAGTPFKSPFGPDGSLAVIYRAMRAVERPTQIAGDVRQALGLAREYISQDHGGFKESDGYFEQTARNPSKDQYGPLPASPKGMS